MFSEFCCSPRRTTTTVIFLLLGIVIDYGVLGNPGIPEIFSGDSNVNEGTGAVIMGGQSNSISSSALSSAMLGGQENIIEPPDSTLIGGQSNWIKGSSGSFETLVGGKSNRVQSKLASLLGGRTNRAKARYSSIGGGFNNLVTGRFSSVPGGTSNTVRGKYGISLGNYASVRSDNSMMVNLVGTQKLLDTPNTVVFHVANMFINGHDVEEVHNEVTRRNRKLNELLGNHVQSTNVDVVGEHVLDQHQSLSDRVAELHSLVKKMQEDVSTKRTFTQKSRRRLNTFKESTKTMVHLINGERTNDNKQVSSSYSKYNGEADGLGLYLNEGYQGKVVSHGIMNEFTNETEIRTLKQHEDRIPLENVRYLRSDINSDQNLAEYHDLKESETMLTSGQRGVRDMNVRRRLVNSNSDYPRDGTMVQEYQQTVTARVDEMEGRLLDLETRLAIQQSYFDDGYLIGDFDCSVNRRMYGDGPCNICGAQPRLQYRLSDPFTGGSSVVVCDGSGTEDDAGNVLIPGSWHNLV
jgi:hypothetical protein